MRSSVYPPLPTWFPGAGAISSSPTVAGTMANGALDTIAGRSPPPRSRSTITVRSPSARTPSVETSVEAPLSRSRAPTISATSDASGDRLPGVNSRRQLWTTSAAVSGVPSLNVRPSRSVKVTWRPSSVTAHDSARAGRTVSEGSTAVSVSYSWLTNEALPRSPWRAGSIEAGVPATMVTVPGSAAATGSGLVPLAAGHRRTAIATMTSRAITPTTRRRRPDGGATGPAWTSHGPDGVGPATAGGSGGGGGSAGGGAASGDAVQSASSASRGVRSSATRPPPAARDRVAGDRGAVPPGPGAGASPTTRSPCRRTRPREPRYRPSDAPREYTGGSPEAPAGASRDPRGRRFRAACRRSPGRK